MFLYYHPLCQQISYSSYHGYPTLFPSGNRLCGAENWIFVAGDSVEGRSRSYGRREEFYGHYYHLILPISHTLCDKNSVHHQNLFDWTILWTWHRFNIFMVRVYILTWVATKIIKNVSIIYLVDTNYGLSNSSCQTFFVLCTLVNNQLLYSMNKYASDKSQVWNILDACHARVYIYMYWYNGVFVLTVWCGYRLLCVIE